MTTERLSGQDPIDIPDGSLEVDVNPFAMAVSDVLGQLALGSNSTVHVGRIASMVLGEDKLPKDEFHLFLDAVNEDGRVTFLGGGRYRFLDADDSHTGKFKPEEHVVPAGDLEEMLRVMRRNNPQPRRKPFSRRRVHFKVGADMDGYTDEVL